MLLTWLDETLWKNEGVTSDFGVELEEVRHSFDGTLLNKPPALRGCRTYRGAIP